MTRPETDGNAGRSDLRREEWPMGVPPPLPTPVSPTPPTPPTLTKTTTAVECGAFGWGRFLVVCFLYKINPNPRKITCCGEKRGPYATFNPIFS